MDQPHDADAPGEPGRLFGLPAHADARLRVLPVPFDATSSYRRVAAAGPAGVLAESAQVDLQHRRYGAVWRSGIELEDAPRAATANEHARAAADRWREHEDPRDRAEVDTAGEQLCDEVHAWTAARLAENRVPALLGGDHSVALGALRALPPGIGILQFDAHADLRDAYEGFAHSHASVMRNALKQPRPLTQLGIRDFGAAEAAFIEQHGVHTLFDADVADQLAAGRAWGQILAPFVDGLPEAVWISFDVDGLEPALCPGTGTPVPGGLTWHQATASLAAVVASGRRIVGFDLCEVGPTQWDAIVGARLLYELSCAALASQP